MNKKIGLGIVGVVVLVGVFYAGISYGKKQASTAQNQGGNRSFASGQRSGRNGGGFIGGQIIAKDANSITEELRALSQDGSSVGAQTGTPVSNQGSKIVFYTDKTTVMKTADGSIADLAIGEQVSVTGTPNTDGSVNAQSVQIRPATTRQN